MNRKILNNKFRSKRVNGYAENRIGNILGIQDKNGEWLLVGDKIRYGNYRGRILFDGYQYVLMLDYSMWYGTNEFSISSYGKSIPVPMDNGGKMEMELLERN